jgi:hypothetical protein
MHLVEINAQPIEGETNARDHDFSRTAVQARWRAGYADTCRMLERRPWNDPIDPATAFYGPPCSEKRRLARANPSMPASVRWY